MSRRNFYGTMLLVTGLFLVFGLLLLGVHLQSPWLQQLDGFGSQLIQATITPEKTQGYKIITFFGNFSTIVWLAFGVGLVLYVLKQRMIAIWFVTTALVCGGLVPYLCKLMVHRARPPQPLIPIWGYSFPSGHATGAAVFYGLLMVLAVMYLKATWKKCVVVLVLSILILAIMASRVYLGVHYFSDVIAGLALGSAQVLLVTDRYLTLKH